MVVACHGCRVPWLSRAMVVACHGCRVLWLLRAVVVAWRVWDVACFFFGFRVILQCYLLQYLDGFVTGHCVRG